jgi:hypothetical protein
MADEGSVNGGFSTKSASLVSERDEAHKPKSEVDPRQVLPEEKTETGSSRYSDAEPPQTQRFVLLLMQDAHNGPPEDGGLYAPLVAKLRRQAEDLIVAPRDLVEIDIWLESPGGDAHAAYKLALLLRSYSCRLRVVVPDWAKSAATLLALAADEIYMGRAAELGPLDAQIPHEGELVSMISALDVARSIDDLARTAMELAFRGGASALLTTGLSRSETLMAMLDFSAKFMEPVVSQLDPKMIHWSSTLLTVASEYAERLLSMREIPPSALASQIPKALVDNYPTHSFVIGLAEAQGLGLPAKTIDDYDLRDTVCALHRSYEDGDINLIDITTVESLKGERGDKDDDQKEGNDGS